MKIAVNTRLLLPEKLDGIGWFTYESLKRITQNHQEHEFIFIFDRPYHDEFIFSKNITPVIAHPQARHPVLWYLFFEFGIPAVLDRYGPDIFLSPDGWLSLRSNIPSVAVIHDLNFFHEPRWVSRLPRYYYNYFFPRYIRHANRIATVSEYSRKDISSRFGIAKSSIDVVYNGVNNKFLPVAPEEQQQVRNRFTGGLPYFLFLGLVHPRKNLTRIIHAYEEFRNSQPDRIKLLVAGSTKYWTIDTKEAFEKSGYKDDIVFTGRIPDQELNGIIGASVALVYASLFEGFGIPILEAMQCDVPVITSNVTAMPEVGGEAVIYVDPYSIRSISAAMLRIYKDKGLQKDLIDKGKKQLQKFSWDMTAEKLWKSVLIAGQKQK